MTPSETLRTDLRELLDETIPTGGTESDTRFTTARIDALLTAADDLNEAAYNGWTLKAAKAMSERGGLESSASGTEKLIFVALKDYRDHCLQMASMFADLIPGGGSRLMAFDPPSVAGGLTE